MVQQSAPVKGGITSEFHAGPRDPPCLSAVVMSDKVATPQSARIAAKYARSPEVKRLFEELSRQHETLAAMQTEFIQSIKRNRAMREGKAAKPSKPGKRTLEEFDRNAEKANEHIECLSQTMNDRALLTCELSGVQQMIQFDEAMLSAWHDDDKPMANSIINFQREMLKLIEDFINNSCFNGKITSV
jgi:hypothetical protein